MVNGLYRTTLKSGSLVSGHYRYSDVFQILESQKISSFKDGKFVDIEYNQAYGSARPALPLDISDDEAFYQRRLQELAHLDLLKELIALLSIATNQYYDIDYDNKTNIRPSEQLAIDKFTDTSSSLDIRKDPNRVIQRQNYTLSFLSIHPDADKFFENYFKLSAKARLRYNASIFIYQSMRKILLTSASMAIVGLISAIENLMDFEVERTRTKIQRCKNCNQPIYTLTKRFKEFMSEFSEFNVDDTDNLLRKFYSRRSEISHAGKILEIDRLLSTFSMKEHREFTEIETHVRIALFNYLLKYDFDGE